MKFKVVFEDYMRAEHVAAIRTLLAESKGVEILEDNKDGLLISVSEDMADVIEDMSLCDYLTAVKQED